MQEGTSDCRREEIIGAALKEFVARGIDKFSIENVALRAGVDTDEILRVWGDRRVLLMETTLRAARLQAPTPDTGSLRGDAEATAAMIMQNTQDGQWRKRVHRLLAASRDTDFSEVRADFWDIRYEDFHALLQRAADRGELRDDIDFVAACKMFIAAIFYDIVWNDEPVNPHYAEQVVTMFLRAISR